jgi:hypothetical protein
MEITERATSGHGARMDASPLAIIELHLASLPAAGTPARVLKTFLDATFSPNPEDLKFFHQKFDIDGEKAVGRHQAKMKKLVTSLRK